MKILTPVTGNKRTYHPGDEAAFALEFKDRANLHRLAAMGVIALTPRPVAAAKVAKKRAPRKRAPRKK